MARGRDAEEWVDEELGEDWEEEEALEEVEESELDRAARGREVDIGTVGFWLTKSCGVERDQPGAD